MSSKKAVIIGAGYAGIALANLLAKAGYTVEVFEKNAELGGRIQTVYQDGFRFEIGPSWYLMPEVFEQYYRLFGKSARDELELVRLSPGYRVFSENNPAVTIVGDEAQDTHTFDALQPGSGARLERYLATSSLAYKIATKYFLYSTFERPGDFVNRVVIRHSPKLAKLLPQTLHRYVAKQFLNPQLQKILEYHMVFLGCSPFQAPALYTLMSHLDFQSGIFYPKKGMQTLVDSMVQLGTEGAHRKPIAGAPIQSTAGSCSYHTNASVKKIIVENGRAVGIELADTTVIKADIVIANSDLHFTETKLLEPRYQSFPEKYWHKRQPGPSALLISLGVKGSLPQLLHHNLFLVDEWQENFRAIYTTHTIPEHASLYICNPTKTDPSVAPKGHENVFILLPLASAVNYTKRQMQSLAHRTIQQVATCIDQPDLLDRIVTQHIFYPEDFGSLFNGWQNNAFGGESHLLKQSVIFRTPNKSRKVKNLYYVGAGTTPGIILKCPL